MMKTHEHRMKHSTKNAIKVYSEMTPEMRKAFLEVVKNLRKHEELSVVEVTDSWFIIEHSHLDYFVQLQVDPKGANLDAVLIGPSDEDRFYPMRLNVSSTTKLTKDNVNFSVQRILAMFGMHERTTSFSPQDDEWFSAIDQISMNNSTEKFIKDELAFMQAYPTNNN